MDRCVYKITGITVTEKQSEWSTAVEQVVACALVTQRARVQSPVGISFLGEVFRDFSSPVRQMSGSFRPPRSPNIIWPSLSSVIIHYGRQSPEMLTRPKISNIQIYRASVWEQQLYEAPLGGGPASQGRERQPSVAARSIWMTLYLIIKFAISTSSWLSYIRRTWSSCCSVLLNLILSSELSSLIWDLEKRSRNSCIKPGPKSGTRATTHRPTS